MRPVISSQAWTSGLNASKGKSHVRANAAIYGGAGIIVQIFRLVQEVLLRRLLTTEIIGIIGLGDLVQSFAKSLDLGVVVAAGRDLPLLRGAGRLDEEAIARRTALWGYVAQAVIFAIPVVVYALVAVTDPNIRWALCAASLVQVLTAACEARQLVLQSVQNFASLSRVNLSFALIYAACVVSGAELFGLRGVLVGGVAAWIVQTFLLRHYIAGLVLQEGRLDFRVLKSLISFGLPLKLCDYPTALAFLVDSMIVGKLFGLEGLAIYSTARAFFNQALELPTRFGSVVLMRLYHDDAAEGRAVSAAQLARFLKAQYFLILPVLVCGFAVGLRFLASCFLPRYMPTVAVAEVLILEAYFVPQISLMRNYWIIDKNLRLIAVSGSLWLISRVVLLYWLAVGLKLGLIGAAWACVASAIVYYAFLLIGIGHPLWGGAGSTRLGLSAIISAAVAAIAVRQLNTPMPAVLTAAMLVAVRQLTGMMMVISPLILFGLLVVVAEDNDVGSVTVCLPRLSLWALFFARIKRRKPLDVYFEDYTRYAKALMRWFGIPESWLLICYQLVAGRSVRRLPQRTLGVPSLSA